MLQITKLQLNRTMRNKKSLFLLIILFFQIGCSHHLIESKESPLKNKSWTFEFDNLSFEKEGVFDEIHKSLSHDLKSEERSYLKEMIKKELENRTVDLKENNEKYCSNIFDILGMNVHRKLKRFATFKHDLNTAAGEDKIKQKSYYLKVKDGYKNKYSAEYSHEYVVDYAWKVRLQNRITTSSRSAISSIKLKLKSDCENYNYKSQKVYLTIPDYYIQTPMTGLLYDKMAIMGIDWNEVEKKLNNINKRIIYDLNKPIIQDIKSNILRDINNRYVTGNVRKYEKEVTFSVSNQIVLSRIQRYWDNFKFDKENSRFEFKEEICVKKSACTNIKYVMKIFPESGNRTAISNTIYYNDIFDNLSQKTVLSQKEIISSFNKKYLVKIKKVLNKN